MLVTYLLFDDLPPQPMRRELISPRWQFWRKRYAYWSPCGIIQEDGSIVWPQG